MAPKTYLMELDVDDKYRPRCSQSYLFEAVSEPDARTFLGEYVGHRKWQLRDREDAYVHARGFLEVEIQGGGSSTTVSFRSLNRGPIMIEARMDHDMEKEGVLGRRNFRKMGSIADIIYSADHNHKEGKTK